ncbi:hypothetical protein [Bergeyella sp. RCAD1439]|uniref:hypothetical protein n=1 Tax=Bergeyella anatis TaxID=3113737 RepID=UPI002E199BDF|nr:hypothetical protein [Bergeyella sp. RCAD1439]
MINILWSQFDINQQAKDISFESFCFQVAYLRYREFGFFENYFNTPGSEFYLKLHTDCLELNLKAGDEIGWQVKWWYNTEDNTSLTKDRRRQLSNNFATTLKIHPDIKLWIICTPASFTESAFNQLKRSLQELSPNTQFLHWNKETFRNFFFENQSLFGGLFHHYFNSNFIGFKALAEYTEKQIEYLQNKFNTDLYVPSHYDEEIIQLLDYNTLFNELELKSTYIQDDITHVKRYIDRKDIESFLNPDYANGVLELIEFICQTLEEISQILVSKLNIEKCKKIDEKIDEYIKVYHSFADKLNKNIKENKWAKDEDSNQYDWRHRDIIEQINYLHSHFVEIENSEERFRNHKPLPISFTKLLDSVFQKDVHILSSAGYGKTNIACNIAKTCIEKNIPAVLLLGSNFRNSNLPQKTIIELLSIERDYSFKEFLQALNTLGFTKGVKIPIIIDGLNESNPYKDIWQTHIFDIVQETQKLDYLCLITTCRDRYINSIFEKEKVTDIENTFVLEGLTEKQKQLAVPKYFEKYNIVPTSWNFDKDLFKHPLLLKIFCEANEGARHINISIDNIFQSFDKYYNNIIIKVTDNDSLAKRNIDSRISQLCTKLWNDNSRHIGIVDFVSIIDPQSEKLSGTFAIKILDEGLCLFQRNLDDTKEENIQFAYDLVAGYLIASKVLLAEVKTVNDLVVHFDDNLQKKLFDENLTHPLAEDIMISLLYLLPTKYDVELFEIFDNATSLEICCRNIDYYINNFTGQEKIKKIFTNTTTDNPNFNILLNKLFENIFQKGIYGLSQFALSILMPLSQVEIDINWAEIIRKNNTTSYDLLLMINKTLLYGKISITEAEDFFCISFLSTVSTNLILRELATENLYLIGRNFPDHILTLFKIYNKFQDVNAIESLLASLCGIVLFVKNEGLTLKVMSFLVDDLLPSLNNTHIGIIDYILTISEFALAKYGIDYSAQLNFNKSFIVPDLSTDDKQYSPFNSTLTGVDMYDFIKYQIAYISSDNYHKRDTFTENDSIKIVLNRVKEKGYDEDLFAGINKSFQEDDRYRYGRGSKIKFYAEKYLWQSYFEFVGYLFLENKLNSDDENRYRCLDIYFDPAFPRLPSRNQIIPECFFPEKDADIQEWINSENQNFIDKYYIHKIFTNDDWVLLSASINQEGKENDTRFNLYANAFLIENDKINAFEKDIDTEAYHFGNGTYFYNIYAGEIAWSKFIEDKEKYFDNEKYSLTELVWDYRWSSWSNNRYENSSFPFLNAKIAIANKLDFSLKDLSFYNSNNEQVTKIMWCDSALLYYIRKDILEQVMKSQKKHIVWCQFVSKYGEFGSYNEKKLNLSFKDLRKMINYNLLNKD